MSKNKLGEIVTIYSAEKMEFREYNSIELLFTALWNAKKDRFDWHSVFEHAKKIYEKEIMDAYTQGATDAMSDEKLIDCNKYYNEKFTDQDEKTNRTSN